jgi:hypothetical protein
MQIITSKERHKWDKQILEFEEKAKCLKCGLIKESKGWVGGFIYYFEEDDFYLYKTTSCGDKITNGILKDAQFFLVK